MDKLAKLLGLNVNEFTEDKNGLKYLTWSKAWEEFLKVYPDATYDIEKDASGRCYFGDPDIGYMVYTSVTAEGITRSMWLPVMDGANKSMMLKPYTYQVKDWNESKKQKKDVYKEKSVEAISMFDINKTVMRCLTKNLAMFGLGLYIFKGEDLPTEMPTNLDCNELITVGASKGKTATVIEKWLKAQYGHGMEFLTENQLKEAIAYMKTLEDK